jgi:hypothetical protein
MVREGLNPALGSLPYVHAWRIGDPASSYKISLTNIAISILSSAEVAALKIRGCYLVISAVYLEKAILLCKHDLKRWVRLIKGGNGQGALSEWTTYAIMINRPKHARAMNTTGSQRNESKHNYN